MGTLDFTTGLWNSETWRFKAGDVEKATSKLSLSLKPNFKPHNRFELHASCVAFHVWVLSHILEFLN